MKKTAQKIIKIAITALITAFVLFFVTKIVLAQMPTRTFTLVPPTVENSLDPGQTAEGIMKIINDADETLTFTATTQDFIVEDPTGVPTILPENTLSNKYSAASWIATSPEKFTVKPHERFELNYYLQVPLDAKPGGHYAAVVFKPDELIKVEGTGTAVNTQIGTLFYINVNGDIKEDARVTKFSSNGLQEYGPVKILTQIKNLGDLHIKPVGVITITDLLGRKVATLPFAQHNVFPEATRDYENVFNQKLLFGPFQARFIATYGKGNNLPLMATMTFWVLPWKIMLVAVLVIVAIILGVMYWKKNKLRKQEENPPAGGNKENPED
jgi:hypothetical protein